MDNKEKTLSRRKALGRIGLIATAAYTIPAFATLSMARASSGTSDVSSADTSAPSADVSTVSEPSVPSAADETVSAASTCEELATSTDANLADAGYVQCMVDNNFELGPDFAYPAGVKLANGTITP